MFNLETETKLIKGNPASLIGKVAVYGNIFNQGYYCISGKEVNNLEELTSPVSELNSEIGHQLYEPNEFFSFFSFYEENILDPSNLKSSEIDLIKIFPKLWCDLPSSYLKEGSIRRHYIEKIRENEINEENNLKKGDISFFKEEFYNVFSKYIYNFFLQKHLNEEEKEKLNFEEMFKNSKGKEFLSDYLGPPGFRVYYFCCREKYDENCNLYRTADEELKKKLKIAFNRSKRSNKKIAREFLPDIVKNNNLDEDMPKLLLYMVDKDFNLTDIDKIIISKTIQLDLEQNSDLYNNIEEELISKFPDYLGHKKYDPYQFIKNN